MNTPRALGVPRRAIHTWDLLANLVSRDFRARYKDSVLGLVWAVVNPLAQLLIYYFLFQKVLTLGIRRYSSYAFIGLIAWGWFASTLNESVRILKNSRHVVEQPGFPAPILPFVSAATNLVDFLIALPLVGVIILIEGYPLHATLVALPLVMAVQFAFILGFAYLSAGVNAAFRDTQHVLTVALQLYFFLTPIFYDVNSIPERFRPIFELNPMLHLVEAYRAILMHGTWPPVRPLLYVALFSLASIAAGLRVYHWARYRYLEEM